MKMQDYQRLAMQTKRRDLDHNLSVAVAALGLAGEAGEAADYLKKVVGHGHPVDRKVLAKELGDVLWYVASLCDEYGLDLEAVAAGNIVKLRRRYPQGFREADSRARRDVSGGGAA